VVVILWHFDLQLPMQSVPITTDVVSSFVCLMVCNATFNNISAISWRSVLYFIMSILPLEKLEWSRFDLRSHAFPIGKPRVSPLLSLNTSVVIRYLICVYASHFFAGRPYHIIIYFHSSQCRLIPYLHQRPIFFKTNSSIVAILELIRGAQCLIEVILKSDSHETWKCVNLELERQIRCFPYGEHCDVPQLQKVEQKAVGRQRNLGLM
jgi:hypothetical protein